MSDDVLCIKVSNRQDWVGGQRKRKGRAGKISAAHQEEGSNWETSFGQTIPATSWTKQTKRLPNWYFPVPWDFFEQLGSIYYRIDLQRSAGRSLRWLQICNPSISSCGKNEQEDLVGSRLLPRSSCSVVTTPQPTHNFCSLASYYTPVNYK